MKLIAVVGTGTMGCGIVQALAQSGFPVLWKSRSSKSLDAGIAKVSAGLQKALGEKAGDSLARIKGTTNYADLVHAEFVIESISEDEGAKCAALTEIEANCNGAVIATNTSSLSITRLSKALKDPGRFAGMHFFNPVHKMALVEVVMGERTSKSAASAVSELAKALGKTPITVKDSPGFVVNRMLMPFLNDAVLLVENKVASVDDVDAAARLGLNHPMGPLALLDLIGLDVFAATMRSIGREPCETVKRMMRENKLGRKTGEGFYKYTQTELV